MAEIERMVKEALIDGDFRKLLERSRQGKKFNLCEELEKQGYSIDEISQAAIREMERQAQTLRRIGNILIVQAIAEGLFEPEDLD